jgi:O-antigen/teichoic acid export membrane protein
MSIKDLQTKLLNRFDLSRNNIIGLKKILNIGLALFFKLITLVTSVYTLRWVNINFDINLNSSFIYFTSVVSIVLTVTSFGLGPLIQIEYLKEVEKKVNNYKSLWNINIGLQLITMICLLVIFNSLFLINLININIFFLSILVVTLCTLAIDGNYKSISDINGNVARFTVTETISKILILLGLFIITFYFKGNIAISAYFILLLFCALFQLGLDIYFNNQFWFNIELNIKKSILILKKYKSILLQLSLSTFLIAISATTDKWFLFSNGYKEELIGYSNIYKLLELTFVLESIIFPTLFFNLIKGKDLNESWSKFIFKSKWFYLIIMIPVLSSISFTFACFVILPFINAGKYTNISLEVFPYFLVIVMTSGFNLLLGNIIIFKKKQYIELFSIVLYCIVSLILYQLLIPQFKHIGAAAGSLIGSLTIIISKSIYYLIDRKASKKF